MDQELQRLVDRQKIVDLSLRYAKAVDSRDGILMRNCFMPHSVFSLMAMHEFVGLDAIENALEMLAGLDITQHVMTNQIVDFVADGATMQTYCIATHVKHDHPSGAVFTAGGVYDDSLERWSGEWRIAHRKLTMLWSTGDATMLFPMPPAPVVLKPD